MQKLMVLLSCLILASALSGCATRLTSLDVGKVQSDVIKGKTTAQQVKALYGKPYEVGLMKDGTTFYYYLSANSFTGSSQDFTFYFDKDLVVKEYASEYPTGNPLQKK